MAPSEEEPQQEETGQREGDNPPTQDGKEHGKDHATLKYHLLGPSLTKAGQDSVDQTKVSEIIYNASKGSKFFHHEEARDKVLTAKIAEILARKRQLDALDLGRERRQADIHLAELEQTRDLSQVIVHVDCDAFFAAVERLDRPELADDAVPFAVGGGVLTTCNYAARRYGCRSGMAAFVARRLCPHLRVLPLHHAKYAAKAAEVRAVLARYDPRFEAASVDEAYLNLTAYCAARPGLPPDDAVRALRAEVRDATGVTVSAGIAANARLAKICSNVQKPDGQFRLPPDRRAILAFMRDLPCRKVPGIGRVLERQLAALGVRTCGDIYAQRQFLHRLFGAKVYEFLLRCHLGLGRTRVQPAEEYERKSIGTESTFRDEADPTRLRATLRRIAEELEADMRRAGCRGRTLVLKVKLHTYEVHTRQVAPPRSVCRADDLYRYALPMLARFEQEMPGLTLRLMGLRCTNLVSTQKPDTLAFFGLKPRRKSGGGGGAGSGSSSSNDHRGNDQSERRDADVHTGEEGDWEPGADEDELFGAYEGDVEMDQGLRDGGLTTGNDANTTITTASNTNNINNNNTNTNANGTPEPNEEWWDCPVCGRPQTADERRFNEHIDLCLSRQTIRDAVQQHSTPPPGVATATAHESQRPKAPAEKKRGRPAGSSGRAAAHDPRQKRLCFG